MAWLNRMDRSFRPQRIVWISLDRAASSTIFVSELARVRALILDTDVTSGVDE
jgi:hypothetical protein